MYCSIVLDGHGDGRHVALLCLELVLAPNILGRALESSYSKIRHKFLSVLLVQRLKQRNCERLLQNVS